MFEWGIRSSHLPGLVSGLFLAVTSLLNRLQLQLSKACPIPHPGLVRRLQTQQERVLPSDVSVFLLNFVWLSRLEHTGRVTRRECLSNLGHGGSMGHGCRMYKRLLQARRLIWPGFVVGDDRRRATRGRTFREMHSASDISAGSVEGQLAQNLQQKVW